MTSPVRPEMVSSAITFLTDPTVQSRSLSERVSFLESKGLTSLEIDEAMKQSGQSVSVVGPTRGGVSYQPSGSAYYQQNAMMQQQAQAQQGGSMGRDWRDWFIMAVVSGTVGYGVISLARVS